MSNKTSQLVSAGFSFICNIFIILSTPDFHEIIYQKPK
jgi:hypothetical protein